MPNERKPPEEVKQLGLVRLARFANEVEFGGKTRTIDSFSISRLYRDREGNWKSSCTLNADDLPVAAVLLSEMSRKLIETKQSGE